MKTDQSSTFLLLSRDVVVILLLLPPLNRAIVPQQPTPGGGSCAARRRARHSLGRLSSFPQGRRRHSPPSSSQPRDSPTATYGMRREWYQYFMHSGDRGPYDDTGVRYTYYLLPHVAFASAARYLYQYSEKI